MSFRQALSSFWSNYTNFKGRTPRSGYWWVALFLVLVSFVLFAIDLALFGSIWPENLLNQGLGPISIVFILVVLVPGLSIGFRRLHDTGRSAWWLLMPLAPSLLAGVVAPRPDMTAGIPSVEDLPIGQLVASGGLSLLALVGSIVLLVFYLQKSQPGENKYGPNPLGN